MTRTELKAIGIKLGEIDYYDDSIYASTTEYYYYLGDVYAICSYNNQLNYYGENSTFICGTAETFKNYVILDYLNNWKSQSKLYRKCNQETYKIYCDMLKNLEAAMKK